MSKRIRAHIFLLATAFIWGAAIVVQKDAMSYIGPFTFTCVRMLLGGTVLIPLIFFMNKKNGVTPGDMPEKRSFTGDPSFIGGFLCGIALFLAITIQQIGIIYTTASKVGFITAMYIIIVPILGVFMKKRISKVIWLCAILAVAGLYMLCMEGSFSMSKGDLLVLVSAFAFAMHILTVDRFSPLGNPIKISCIQFFVCGGLCIPTMIVEAPALSVLLSAWLQIFYTGAISCGVAYTLQVVAQRDTTATITAILLSFESVFAALTGVLMLNEMLTMKQLAGCVLMFAAIIMAQMPEKPRGEKLKNREDN